MLSTHSGEEEIYRAMQAGARGYIVKSIIREELLRAVREVHQGRRIWIQSLRRIWPNAAPIAR